MHFFQNVESKTQCNIITQSIRVEPRLCGTFTEQNLHGNFHHLGNGNIGSESLLLADEAAQK